MLSRILTTTMLSCALMGCSMSVAVGPVNSSTEKQTQADVTARDLSLTVYSSADPVSFDPEYYIALQSEGLEPFSGWSVPGFGVVRDVRMMDLKKGVNQVTFSDVAQFIDPTTVNLRDMSLPENADENDKLTVLQQEFAFDLVSAQKLLTSYIDKQITLNQKLADGNILAITGKLLSTTQGKIVLQTEQGMRILNWGDDIQLGKLPEGLLTRPTLQWELFAPKAGQRQTRTSYQTGGLSWRAEYNLILSEDETHADLSAWVSLLNLSGTSYPNTELKLIAGNLKTYKQMILEERNRDDGYSGGLFGDGGFVESPFFEYHIYALPRPVTVKQNALMQLTLFPMVHHISVKKVLNYTNDHRDTDSNRGPNLERRFYNYKQKSAIASLIIENKKDNQLGIPLPGGLVRAFKADNTKAAGKHKGTLEYIGENTLDHTANNQTIKIYLGDSFDVHGETKQIEFTLDKTARSLIETIEITLTNGKKIPQEVTVDDSVVRWHQFEIVKASQEYEMEHSHHLKFHVTIPPEGKQTITYTVKYTWDEDAFSKDES